MNIEITNQRQTNGYKHCADQYRVIGGEHFIQWTSFATEEMISDYRAAGIKCRRAAGELFIRMADASRASVIDQAKNYN